MVLAHFPDRVDCICFNTVGSDGVVNRWCHLTFCRNGRISTFFVVKHKYYCLLSSNEENTIPLRFIGFLSRVPQ